jgi:phytoene synthase
LCQNGLVDVSDRVVLSARTVIDPVAGMEKIRRMRLSPPQQVDSEAAPAFAAVRRICRREGRSFYFAAAFLSRAKRDASYAVYAFCRMIEQAIGEPLIAVGAGGRETAARLSSPKSSVQVGFGAVDPVAQAGSSGLLDHKLALLRDRLDEIYDQRLELPRPEFRTEEQHALCAFSRTVARYQIPKKYFLELAEGRRMALTISRYATWAGLERYCYHVAGVVGLMMSCVLGLTNSGAAQQAVQMGNAMQLTNILRDIKEDWERKRIYLPLEDLMRFRYSERDLAAGLVNENFRQLMRFEIDRARGLYRQAAEGLVWLAGDGSRMTAASMAVIHSGILGEIERQDYDVFSHRAGLNPAQQLRRLPAAWRLSRRKGGQAVPAVFG